MKFILYISAKRLYIYPLPPLSHNKWLSMTRSLGAHWIHLSWCYFPSKKWINVCGFSIIIFVRYKFHKLKILSSQVLFLCMSLTNTTRWLPFWEKKLVLIWLKRTILSWYTQDEMYLNSQYYNTWSVAHTEWYKRSSLYGKIFGSKVSQQCCISLNIFQSQYFSGFSKLRQLLNQMICVEAGPQNQRPLKAQLGL